MKHFRPRTIAEAVGCLSEANGGALLYAGGLEVVFALRTAAVSCTALIDTKRIDQAASISRSGDEVRIGPAARHHTVCTDPVVAAALPLLGLACGQVGTIRIRMQGTIGGNFGNGHQHTDPGTAAMVYGGDVDLVCPTGRRSVPVAEFWWGPGQTAVQRDEVIESIRLRPLPGGWTVAHDRVETLHRPPTAIISMAARIVDGAVAECRIAAGGVPSRPLRLLALEDALTGARAGDVDQVVEAAEPAIAEAVDAQSDLLGSADFKVILLAGLVRRATSQILDRSPTLLSSAGDRR